jgi:hypothetical protein
MEDGEGLLKVEQEGKEKDRENGEGEQIEQQITNNIQY